MVTQKRARQRNQQRQQNLLRGGLFNDNNRPQNGDLQGLNNPDAVEPTFFNKAKELVICFISSLSPSWDVNAYIENNPVVEPILIQDANPQQEPQAEPIPNNDNNLNPEINLTPNLTEQVVLKEKGEEAINPSENIIVEGASNIPENTKEEIIHSEVKTNQEDSQAEPLQNQLE